MMRPMNRSLMRPLKARPKSEKGFPSMRKQIMDEMNVLTNIAAVINTSDFSELFLGSSIKPVARKMPMVMKFRKSINTKNALKVIHGESVLSFSISLGVSIVSFMF